MVWSASTSLYILHFPHIYREPVEHLCFRKFVPSFISAWYHMSSVISRNTQNQIEKQQLDSALFFIHQKTYASVSSKHQHPPGQPQGVCTLLLHRGRDLYFLGAGFLHIHKITFKMRFIGSSDLVF